MIFETHSLSAPLAGYIESVFHFKDFMPDHSIERAVPTGHSFLIFELDGFQRNTFNNDTLEPNGFYTKVWVSGMHRNYISISAHQKSEMFVIQFKAFGAYPFFHFPMLNITEKICPAETVLGDDILKLREQLLEQKTSLGKFSSAENWLLSRFDACKIPPPELTDILEKLQNAPASGYNQIIETYPNTQKHLIGQFKKYIGLTPKYFQRILRFNEILQHVQKNEKISWAQIAYRCGFSDQSHFIKEFRHFSGFNPEEFIQQDFHRDESNFFPLDREG